MTNGEAIIYLNEFILFKKISNTTEEEAVECFKLAVKALQQQTYMKKGHWIGHREHCERLGLIPSGLGVYEWCSNCGHGIDIRDWYRISHNYCPECGAKMESEE